MPESTIPSVLMVAIEETNLPAVQLLVQRGAALDQRDEQGMTALALASEMGFQEAVEVLLAAVSQERLDRVRQAYFDATGLKPTDAASHEAV